MAQMTQGLREHAIGLLTAGMSTRGVARYFNVPISTKSHLQGHFIEFGSTSNRPHKRRPRVWRCVSERFSDIRHHHLMFQHDNAQPHTQFLEAENVLVVPWPAYSPDMSPIEHVWHALDWRVWQCSISRQYSKFRTAIEEEQENIPQATINCPINSMWRRCANEMRCMRLMVVFWSTPLLFLFRCLWPTNAYLYSQSCEIHRLGPDEFISIDWFPHLNCNSVKSMKSLLGAFLYFLFSINWLFCGQLLVFGTISTGRPAFQSLLCITMLILIWFMNLPIHMDTSALGSLFLLSWRVHFTVLLSLLICCQCALYQNQYPNCVYNSMNIVLCGAAPVV